MSYWQAVVLGLVQGFTEFLPVSSSGHLVLAERLAGLHTPGVFVEVALHVATLGSVLIVYGPRLLSIFAGVRRGRARDLRYAGLLILATIPAAAIGVLFNEAVKRAFDSLLFVGIAFVVTGLILWSTRRAGGDRAAPSVWGAIGIGLAQAMAILPGISRSGSTVSAGLWGRLAPAAAAEFSFLMAIPVIGGAALLESRHVAADLAAIGVAPMAVSFTAALVSGIVAIRLLVWLLRRGRFHAFAPYCWGVGAFTLLYASWPV